MPQCARIALTKSMKRGMPIQVRTICAQPSTSLAWPQTKRVYRLYRLKAMAFRTEYPIIARLSHDIPFKCRNFFVVLRILGFCYPIRFPLANS